MQLVAYVKLQARKLSRQAFTERYQHPWLVRALGPHDCSDATLDRLVTFGMPPMTSRLRTRPSAASIDLAGRLLRDHRRYCLHGAVKGALSHSPGRILVGRSGHSDVTLPEPSVSKDHGYLSRDAAGAWFVCDDHSTNGTFVEGMRIESGQPVTLRSGMKVAFAEQLCEFIECGDLYDILILDAAQLAAATDGTT